MKLQGRAIIELTFGMRTRTSMRSRLVTAGLLAGLTSACGAGTAAAISGGGDGGGDTNESSSISSLTVVDANQPTKCRILIALSDTESDPALVEFLYEVPGAAPQRIAHLDGATENPMLLPTSSQTGGLLHVFTWDFTEEELLPDNGSFVSGARVLARVEGSSEGLVLGASAVNGLGNDPPSIEETIPPKSGEVDGIAAIRFTVADSSTDVVSIKVEFALMDESIPGEWQLARPAGLAAQAPTPELAFEGVQAPDAGAPLIFFWDTDRDLLDLERHVALRFTPSDGLLSGTPTATPTFIVDNNDEPIAIVDEVYLHENPDRRRGISIPMRLIDAESDPLTVAVQWSRSPGSFVQLPGDASAVRAILDDPALRKQYQVCAEFPRFIEGKLILIDDLHLRLPEIADTRAQVLAGGLAGKEIEVLRGWTVPMPLASTWNRNPLTRPIATAAIDGGTHLVVLDQPTIGQWRLQDVELAGGATRFVTRGIGLPSALSIERDLARVLVASSVGDAYSIDRVDLQSGASDRVCEWTSADQPGRLRAVESLGSHAALATVGDSLVRLEFGDTRGPRISRLLTGLATPWGIAIDDRFSDCVYIAETGFGGPSGIGRILRVDIHRRLAMPVSVGASTDGLRVERPTMLGLSGNKTRLYALCNEPSGPFSSDVRSVELGLAENAVSMICSELPGGAASICLGSDQLIVITVPGANDLLVGGGVEQRRTIESYESHGQIVTVSEPLTLSPTAPKRWRIAQADSRAYSGSLSGEEASFLWDSSEDVEGLPVFFRATAIDADVGSASPSTVFGREINAPLTGELMDLGTAGVSPRWADLDADGDEDLYFTRGYSIMLLSTEGIGNLAKEPVLIASIPGAVASAPPLQPIWEPIAIDVDRDGYLDLVGRHSEFPVSDQEPGAILIWWNDGHGSFSLEPDRLESAALQEPVSITTADFDADGLQDIAGCYGSTTNAAIFRQSPPRKFSLVDVLTLPPQALQRPVAIAAADFDADSDQDVAILRFAGFAANTVMFLQDPSKSFDPILLTAGSTVNLGAAVSNGLYAADLDGDGYADLCAQASGRSVCFWGPIVDAAPPVTFLSGGNSRFEFADVDGNGLLDACASATPLAQASAILQESPRSFSVRAAVLSGETTMLAPGDFDLDGDIDFSAVASGSLTLLLSGPKPLSRGIAQSGSVDVHIDFDLDGDLDRLSSEGGFASHVTIAEQTYPGFYVSKVISLELPEGGGSQRSMVASDIDGDSAIDLAIILGGFFSGPHLESVVIYRGTKPGSLSPIPIVVTQRRTSGDSIFEELVVSDADADGLSDLLVENRMQMVVECYWQTTDSTFGDPLLLPVGTDLADELEFFMTADLDQDGDEDLVTATSNQRGMTLYRSIQVGPRAFAAPERIISSVAGIGALSAGSCVDIDGDGNVDVNVAADHIQVLWQDQTGSFTRVPSIVGADDSRGGILSSTCADVDGDGDGDLFTQDVSSHALLHFQQRAHRQFDRRATHYAGATGNASTLSVADFNGDGDFDVLTSNGAFLYLGRQ